jgi:hypothetical protein
MARFVALVMVMTAACTPAQAPAAKRLGKVMALGGAGGLIASSVATRYADNMYPLVAVFSVVSAVGIGTYATGELSEEPATIQETLPERHHRWAKILFEHAAGEAREGRCARVIKWEPRVAKYDAHVHDFLYMRDPEILKCLAHPAVMPRPALEPEPLVAPVAPAATEPMPPPSAVPLAP